MELGAGASDGGCLAQRRRIAMAFVAPGAAGRNRSGNEHGVKW